jgi:hypothetical protein
MSERGHFRSGGRGGGRGDSSHRGGRGGGRGAAHGNQQQQEKPKKENILDLTKYMDKAVTVKFNGGRESEHPPQSRSGSLLMSPSHWHIERLRPTNELGSGRCQGGHAR